MNKAAPLTVVVSAALIGGLVWWSSKSGTGSGALQGEFHQSEGDEHVPDGTKVEYKTNPPTSGDHYGDDADWGIYTTELADEQLVHNLEHGGVNVFYQPDKIAKEDLEKLTVLCKQYRSKVVLAPRQKNDTLIALASWQYLEKLDSFDDKKIAEFLQNNRNRGPEQVPD